MGGGAHLPRAPASGYVFCYRRAKASYLYFANCNFVKYILQKLETNETTVTLIYSVFFLRQNQLHVQQDQMFGKQNRGKKYQNLLIKLFSSLMHFISFVHFTLGKYSYQRTQFMFDIFSFRKIVQRIFFCSFVFFVRDKRKYSSKIFYKMFCPLKANYT